MESKAQNSEPGSHGLSSYPASLDIDNSRVLVAFLFLLLLRVDTFKFSLVGSRKPPQHNIISQKT